MGPKHCRQNLSIRRKAAIESAVKSINQLRDSGEWVPFKFYSDEQMNCGLSELPNLTPEDSTRAVEQIEGAATWFRIDKDSIKQPTASESEKQFRKVEKVLSDLLKALDIDPDVDPSEVLVEGEFFYALEQALGGQKAARQFVSSIDSFRAVVSERKQSAAAQKLAPGDRNRRTGDDAVNDFIGSLMAIYGERRPVRTSVVGASGKLDEGIASGPMVRFVLCFIRPLLEPERSLDEDAIRSRIRTLQDRASNQN